MIRSAPGRMARGAQLVEKASQSSPLQRRKRFRNFLRRHVRRRKYFSAHKRASCPSLADNECAAVGRKLAESDLCFRRRLSKTLFRQSQARVPHGTRALFAMQKHSKIAMCRLRRHGMRFQRVGRGRPTCAKLHALLLLLVFVARPERMKFLAQPGNPYRKGERREPAG